MSDHQKAEFLEKARDIIKARWTAIGGKWLDTSGVEEMIVAALSSAAAAEREACARTVSNMIGRGSVYKALRERGAQVTAPKPSREV